MDAEKYDRFVSLLCPTCGNSQLETQDDDEENAIIRCPSCNRTMSKEELLRENGENIDANLEEMKEEVMKDLDKELGDMLKNAFKGSKHIKVK